MKDTLKTKIFTEEQIRIIENTWNQKKLEVERGWYLIYTNKEIFENVINNILKPHYASLKITLAAWEEQEAKLLFNYKKYIEKQEG